MDIHGIAGKSESAGKSFGRLNGWTAGRIGVWASARLEGGSVAPLPHPHIPPLVFYSASLVVRVNWWLEQVLP